MNFSIIAHIPNVSNTGEILNPTEILIKGDAKDQFNYSFQIYHNTNLGLLNVTDLYETLVGTDPDCDKRFTEPIEAHLGMLFSNSDQTLYKWSKNPELNSNN